jgi:hypothetical protein
MLPSFYWTLLAATCGYALWKGRWDERISALVCIAASVISTMVLSPLATRYAQVETGELLVDGLVLCTFVAVALRSNRFWPLWVAGLQLTSSTAHVLKSIDLGLMPEAYAAATRFWSYPILIIIAAGTWRGHQRRLREKQLGPA